jgi:hypothetical protein
MSLQTPPPSSSSLATPSITLAKPAPDTLFQQSFPCPAHLLAEARTAISTNYFWSPYSTLGQFDIPSRAAQLVAISDTPDSYYADPVTSQVSRLKDRVVRCRRGLFCAHCA